MSVASRLLLPSPHGQTACPVPPGGDAAGYVLWDVGVELVSLAYREVRQAGEPAHVLCQ
jgi:hypothetical protein